ncbi:hypothetical protein ACGIF2_11670 [Cellulomonas sp. P22]|uniref:rolling circle replication-associated protein n=1 Tax=Cellulomonas sp. P22 TaxID=3373189 RepID=UPI0037967BF6
MREYVAAVKAKDPDRAAAEAGRRARTALRRYCSTNRLNRLGMLTYAGYGCHDQVQVRADVGEFFRALRVRNGGRPFPYVWVPEWHTTGHGPHVHFAVGQFVPQRVIRETWGHGFVSIELIGDLPVGSGALAESRKAAACLSKYVTKAFTETTDRLPGRRLYDLAQEFKPTKISLHERSSTLSATKSASRCIEHAGFRLDVRPDAWVE